MMIHSLLLLLGILTGMGVSSAADHLPDCQEIAVGEDRPLTLVYIPQEDPEKLIGDIAVISEYLQDELGIPVDGFVALDHAAAVEALRNCTADISFMGGLPYVMAHELAGAEVILGEVHRSQPFYHGRIFVHIDSDIETIEELAGRDIAFADPISESGYLYPLDIFTQAGLLEAGDDPHTFFGSVYFAGGYQQAVEAVINGVVDAAGASENVVFALEPDQLEQVRWIAESDPISSHAVIGRRGLDPGLTEAFTEAMLKLNEPDYQHLLQYVYNPDGYVRTTDEAYEGIRDIARRYGLLPEAEEAEATPPVEEPESTPKAVEPEQDYP
jgi:phosphonate transport system substrate-binding protein